MPAPLDRAASSADHTQTTLRLRRRPALIRALALAAADALALAAAFLAAALPVVLFSAYQAGNSLADLLASQGPDRLPQMAAFSGLALGWFLHLGHYAQRLPFWTEFRHVVLVCAAILLADGFLQYALKQDFSRLWLVHTWGLAVPLLLTGRRLMRALLRAAGLWQVPVVVIGDGPLLDDCLSVLRDEPALGFSVTAVLSAGDLRSGWPGSWQALLAGHRAEAVVLALGESAMAGCRAPVSRLALERVPFVTVRTLGGLPVIGVEAQHVVGRDVVLLSGQSPLVRPLGRTLKLASDYLGALLLLVFCLPALAVVAALVARDGGAVFYGHPRIGRDGRPFRCLKFRTMVPDAPAVLDRLLASDPAARAEWEAGHKLAADPRVTPLGRFLRAHSLDELPQLLNVLRGEMSLVGPRPVTAEELDRFGDDVVFYLKTKPGMTGLWQVSGRSAVDYPRRVQLTVWYVKNWSLWIDMVILLRTVVVALGRQGAA